MQQIQYFKSAWGDIKNSPSWFGKICLLALINFIPIFGQIVTYGYLYGWAREIAWGTHEPMPTRIFGNEDGKLYRRGWFILVLVFVAALVPSIVMSIGSGMQGAGLWGVASGSHSAVSSLMSGVGFLLYLVGLVGLLLLSIFAWIGSMRISIYDRLSAGFQFGKIWKMFRYDTGGIMRIFGMNLLVGFILGVILSIVYFIVVFLIVFAGIASLAASGYNVAALQHMTDAQAMAVFVQMLAGAGIVGFLGILVAMFVTYVATMFVMLLVARAMGYWTLQFDVPHWKGQDDPMPFEVMPPAVGVSSANPVPPVANTPVGGPAAPAPTQAQSAWYGQPQQQPPAYGQAQQQPPAYGQPQQQPPAYGQPQQQYPAYGQEQPAPVVAATPIPVANAAFGQDNAADYAAADTGEGDSDAESAPEAYEVEPSDSVSPDWDAAVSDQSLAEPDQGAAAPSQNAAAGDQGSIAPGQLSGFTYTGASAAPAPVTPSGADPSAETLPDLLVVIPETASADERAESAGEIAAEGATEGAGEGASAEK